MHGLKAPSREAAEAAVTLITTAALILRLCAASADQGAATLQGNVGVAGLLAGLTAAAMLAEWSTEGSWGSRYLQREAGSSGLALGALTLPWVFVGLAVRRAPTRPAAAAAAAAVHTSLAASAAAILLLLLLQFSQPSSPPGASRTKTRQNGTSRSSTHAAAGAGWPLWACGVAALAVLAACAALHTAASAGSPFPAAALLVSAAAAALGAHLLLALLPRVFTLGEAILASQAATLLGGAALRHLLPAGSGGGGAAAQHGPFQRFVLLLTAGAVLATAVLIPLLRQCQHSGAAGQLRLRSRSGAASGGRRAWAVAAAAVAAACLAGLAPAALWAIRFAGSSRRRLLLCAWWASDLAVALPAQHALNSSSAVPAILVRKGYHLLALSLFLPALLLEPQLLGVALAAALALLLAAEAVRLSGLPVVASRLHAFLTSFIDGRDSGLLLVTHLTLLLGMAAPVWLSGALHGGAVGTADAAARAAAAETVPPAAYAGILVVGLGDSAASAVGSLLGRRPICRGSSKTVEGTAAAVAATLAGWALLAAGLGPGLGLAAGGWGRLAAATALSCLLEALTTQLDNIFVPLHYFALLCLL